MILFDSGAESLLLSFEELCLGEKNSVDIGHFFVVPLFFIVFGKEEIMKAHGLTLFTEHDGGLSFELVEVLDNGGVYFFDAVHDADDGDFIGGNSSLDIEVDVFCDSCQGVFQHLFVLAVHADTDGDFYSFVGLDEGEEVVVVFGDEFLVGHFVPLLDVGCFEDCGFELVG